jgi:hypothetical protein
MTPRPDPFFTEPQQRRLEELMARWREAREAGLRLTPEDQAELEGLVDAELGAAAERAAAISRDPAPRIARHPDGIMNPGSFEPQMHTDEHG